MSRSRMCGKRNGKYEVVVKRVKGAASGVKNERG